jgi:hypothetical protein
MPFRHVPPEQFDVDLLKLMQAAYDVACKKLGIDSASDPRSAKLANIIIELAVNGERQLITQQAVERGRTVLGGKNSYSPHSSGLSARFSGDKP